MRCLPSSHRTQIHIEMVEPCASSQPAATVARMPLAHMSVALTTVELVPLLVQFADIDVARPFYRLRLPLVSISHVEQGPVAGLFLQTAFDFFRADHRDRAHGFPRGCGWNHTDIPPDDVVERNPHQMLHRG